MKLASLDSEFQIGYIWFIVGKGVIMKTKQKIKVLKIIVAAMLIVSFSIFAAGCSSSATSDTAGGMDGLTGAPPISIPAPTGGHIGATAPGANGKSLVFGHLYKEDTPLGNVDVTVTNQNTSDSATAVTDDSAYFSVDIPASKGDVLGVTYTDPISGEESEALEITVTDEIQPMSSVNMIPKDVALDKDDGIAVLVANDGTNSEIVEIDMTTGAHHARATFANKTFDKIAIHSGLNFAAILDAGNNMLYWYDLADLSNDMTPAGWDNFYTTPHDVAIVDLDNTDSSTPFDFIVVSNDLDTRAYSYGFVTTYAINNNEAHTLAYPRTQDSINSPESPDGYGSHCYSYSRPACVRATHVSLIDSADNRGWLAVTAEYSDGTKAVHFALTSQYKDPVLGPTISLEVTRASLHGTVIATGAEPDDLVWYEDDTALLADSTNKTLTRLDAAEYNDITGQNLSVGTRPMGVYPDAENDRAFVADEGANKIFDVAMTDLELSETSFTANYAPTKLVYYSEGSLEKIGVIITSPEPLFQTIDVSQ